MLILYMPYIQKNSVRILHWCSAHIRYIIWSWKIIIAKCWKKCNYQ